MADRSKRHALLRAALFLLVIFIFPGGIYAAEDPVDFFRQNCISCHTIGGGRLTGPDLKNVTERKEREWLIRFLGDPQAMMDGGDPYALELKRQARDVVMPRIAGMTKAMAASLLEMIDAESLLEESQFKGLRISDEPFSREEIATGKQYFIGKKEFENGAPACVSCHTTNDIGGLGGGRLGPDLSLVYERLEGRKNLASWLLSPATTTMQPVFKDHPLKPDEILSLVAYLEDRARAGGEDHGAGVAAFLIFGLGGALAALVAFDVIWRFRFRAVRSELVKSGSRSGGN